MDDSPAITYCIVSDGELQEGQIWEAAMSAAHYGLNNLVVLIDNNHMQADGDPADVMNVEPIDAKFEAFGFAVQRVNGNSVPELRTSLDRTRESKNRPSAIVCETSLGFGVSRFSDYRKVHYINVEDSVWAEAIRELS
jgi:transketolase